jgi:hypothetical protein
LEPLKHAFFFNFLDAVCCFLSSSFGARRKFLPYKGSKFCFVLRNYWQLSTDHSFVLFALNSCFSRGDASFRSVVFVKSR